MLTSVILSNYGNDSIALIQWAFEQKLTAVTVVTIDTGWAAPGWADRVRTAQTWVETLGFAAQRLTPKADFPTLIQQRGFPSQKFQWCAGFLKGLPLLTWLDAPENDPDLTATILIAHRRSVSRARQQLPEYIEESAHFGDRRVWHPLYQHTDTERDALVTRAGFDLLTHRSLECDPCVNSDAHDVLRMESSVIQRTAQLEETLQQRMLPETLYHGTTNLRAARACLNTQGTPGNPYECFDMGCGVPYGCGL